MRDSAERLWCWILFSASHHCYCSVFSFLLPVKLNSSQNRYLLLLRIPVFSFRMVVHATYGIIHKVRNLRFRNFIPCPPVRVKTLLNFTPLHPPPLPPSTSVRTIFLKKTWQRYTLWNFVNYYNSKNHKIKRLLYKAIRKCLIIHQDEAWDQKCAI